MSKQKYLSINQAKGVTLHSIFLTVRKIYKATTSKNKCLMIPRKISFAGQYLHIDLYISSILLNCFLIIFIASVSLIFCVLLFLLIIFSFIFAIPSFIYLCSYENSFTILSLVIIRIVAKISRRSHILRPGALQNLPKPKLFSTNSLIFTDLRYFRTKQLQMLRHVSHS